MISIRIDEAAGLALVELAGAVTGPDIVGAVYRLHHHALWDDGFDVIWDGRGVASLTITPKDVPNMIEAKMQNSDGAEITIAIRELDQMMANLCALLLRARGREAKVVTTLEAALGELDLDRLPASLEEIAG